MTFDFVQYMKNIAISLKELLHTENDKHFQRITSLAELEEFLANSRTIQGFQLIVLDKLSGRLDDTSNSDNLLDKRIFTFYIFKNVQHGNFNDHETAIKKCLTIARKIESKMFKEKTELTNGLQHLNRSFYYDSIGPFAHNWYGIMINFNIILPADITYNPNDWQ